MKRSIFILPGILFLLVQTTYTQELKKGDTLNPIHFEYIVGDQTFKAVTSDFKGKVIIFDFWGVNCVDCITSFPKMLALQQKYENKVLFFLVTTDNPKKVNALWKKLEKKPQSEDFAKAAKQIGIIYADTIFSKMFWHFGVPSHAWINANQIVLGVAYQNSLTETNIEYAINDQHVPLIQIRKPDIDYNDPLSWSKSHNLTASTEEYYSIFLNRIEMGFLGPYRHVLKNADGKPEGYAFLNHNPLELYSKAYASWQDRIAFESGEIPRDRILILSNKKDRFITPDSVEKMLWAFRNAYCYAIKFPFNDFNDMEMKMRSDLDFAFGVTSAIKRVNTISYVLQLYKSELTIPSIQTEEKREIVTYGDSTWLIYQNFPLKSLLGELNTVLSAQHSSIPLIDESNYIGNLSVTIPWHNEYIKISMPKIIESLKKQGLKITIEKRMRDMLIIQDKKLPKNKIRQLQSQ